MNFLLVDAYHIQNCYGKAWISEMACKVGTKYPYGPVQREKNVKWTGFLDRYQQRRDVGILRPPELNPEPFNC